MLDLFSLFTSSLLQMVSSFFGGVDFFVFKYQEWKSGELGTSLSGKTVFVIPELQLADWFVH